MFLFTRTLAGMVLRVEKVGPAEALTFLEEEELDLENINPEYKKCPIWMQRELVLEDRAFDLMMKHREEIKEVKRQITELRNLKHRI